MLLISVCSFSMASFAFATGVKSPVASTFPLILSLSFSSRLCSVRGENAQKRRQAPRPRSHQGRHRGGGRQRRRAPTTP